MAVDFEHFGPKFDYNYIMLHGWHKLAALAKKSELVQEVKWVHGAERADLKSFS